MSRLNSPLSGVLSMPPMLLRFLLAARITDENKLQIVHAYVATGSQQQTKTAC